MKVTKVWRNSGWWANLYIELDNTFRVVVRLTNEGVINILLEEVVLIGEQMIVIDNTDEITINSDMVGKEYNLPENSVRLANMIWSCRYPKYLEGTHDLEYFVNLKNHNFFEIDEYEMHEGNATQTIRKYRKDFERFVNDSFRVAHSVALDMVKEQNK